MTDRTFLWLAQVFYATSCVVTLRSLRSTGGGPRLQRANYLAMATGFAFHTVFLYLRGRALGRCPLTNLFETQAFVTWAAVLFFLLIGPSYRVSFLGAFTAPLVLVICLTALLTLVDAPKAPSLNHSAWIEFHAAIAVLACGAFEDLSDRQVGEQPDCQHHPHNNLVGQATASRIDAAGGRERLLNVLGADDLFQSRQPISDPARFIGRQRTSSLMHASQPPCYLGYR